MAAFTSDVDIGNRALQHVGDLRISSFNDPSLQAREIAFAYHKLRLDELSLNLWKFATRRVMLRPLDITTYTLTPAAWSASNIYIQGSIVTYNGRIYICSDWQVTGSVPDQGLPWLPYFGPMTASLYQSGGSYWAGELVYTPQSESYVVYLALAQTSDTPGVFPAWSSSTAYNRGQATQAGGEPLIFSPDNIDVFFEPDNIAIGTPVIEQQSLRDINLGNDPNAATAPHWQSIPPPPAQTNYMTGINWLRLDATLKSIVTPYPLNAGPVSDPVTQNVYQLPNGYLRHAPENPKGGIVPPLGGPLATPWPSEFVFEGNYIVTPSGQADPILLRFVADVIDVPSMETTFCESLAARIAMEVAPILIDGKGADKLAAAKMASANRMYQAKVAQAKLLDAIERGATVTPLDPYIACRI